MARVSKVLPDCWGRTVVKVAWLHNYGTTQFGQFYLQIYFTQIDKNYLEYFKSNKVLQLQLKNELTFNIFPNWISWCLFWLHCVKYLLIDKRCQINLVNIVENQCTYKSFGFGLFCFWTVVFVIMSYFTMFSSCCRCLII